MKLKIIAPLLLCLFAAPTFAHTQHDDEELPMPKAEASKEAKPAAASKTAKKPAAKRPAKPALTSAAEAAPKQP